ncbi:MAG TPA: carboxypeptidase regulatory-like domain-containing protein [Longimicrobium sp.]|nr:carboxypeptidase regulatory-like domain-containing protein [Longimicrobium sp.]
MLRALLVAPLLLSLAAPAAAQTLRGRLLDAATDDPIPAGRVALMTDASTAVRWTLSDEQGWFELEAPRAGEYLVYAARVGFDEQVAGPLGLQGAEPTVVAFRLQRAATRLDPVTVEAQPYYRPLSSTGFYQRQRLGFGHFISPEELERLEARDLREILRMVPGISVDDGAMVDKTRARGRGSVNRLCVAPALIVNGLRMFDGSLEDFPRDHILAIEVYRGPSDVPAQYAGDGFCGVILVWLKV